MTSARIQRIQIIDRETREAALIASLLAMDDPHALDLGDRLSRCRASRARRSGWRGLPDLRETLSKEGRYRCEHHACWSCRRRRIRQVATKEAGRFSNADPLQCSWVTIADSVTGDLSMVREQVDRITRTLRDRRNAIARKRPRWRSVELVGHAELDAYQPNDIAVLAPDQHDLISALPILTHGSDLVWVIRVHVAVRHDDVQRGDLVDALFRKWPGNNRVHVEEFDMAELAVETAGLLLSYSAKHLQRTTIGMVVDDWPVAVQAQYWSWLHSLARGLQPLRVSVGPCQPPRSGRPPDPPSPPPREPMPIILW